MSDIKEYPENELYSLWRTSTGPERDQALIKLVKSLEKHAYSVCWQKIPDHKNEIPWVVGEAVWRAVASAPDFRGDAKFGTWFHRIALNECNRLLKVRRRAKDEVSIEELTLNDKLPVASDPSASILADELLADLTEDDKLLIELEQDGVSSEEIGKILGIEPGTARIRWFRLKARLRDLL